MATHIKFTILSGRLRHDMEIKPLTRPTSVPLWFMFQILHPILISWRCMFQIPRQYLIKCHCCSFQKSKDCFVSKFCKLSNPKYTCKKNDFCSGQGHQGIFSLVKGTLWGNCTFLLEHFKGTKAMIRPDSIFLLLFSKVQRLFCFKVFILSNSEYTRKQNIYMPVSFINRGLIRGLEGHS